MAGLLRKFRGSRQFFIRHITNSEREILDLLEKFKPEDEYDIYQWQY